MTHPKIVPWRRGEFDPRGDIIQRAEFVLRFENGKLTSEYFVLRSANGEYSGREILEGT